MTEIIDEFKSESLILIEQMTEILEKCEDGQLGPESLQQCGLLADRIMGAAKTLALNFAKVKSAFVLIGQLAHLYKLLGYKAAQLKADSELWMASVGVMLDAIAQLREIIEALDMTKPVIVTRLTAAMIDRLEWLNDQYAVSISGSVPMASVVDDKQIEELFAILKS